MKKPKHVKEAKLIGNDSWELINFTQLPKNASRKRQIEALKDDQKWQEDHMIEISSQIDYLIADIDELGKDNL